MSFHKYLVVLPMLAVASLCSAVAYADDIAPPADKRAATFNLKDYHGKSHSLADFDANPIVVIAFLGTECPLAKLYGPRLMQLADHFNGANVAFIGVNSNTHDSNTEIVAYARRHEISFPILKDLGNQFADEMGAQRTPEVFVLDSDRVVRYHGRIDDQYGVGYIRDEPTRDDLRIAIEELLVGKPVSQPLTEAVGCHIGRVKSPDESADVTYSNQVARILQKHCVECHRPGEIAPFSLTNYEEVVGWADTIAEVIEDQRMPPWHANPEHGRFKNERLMTDDEKREIYDWVAAGAPQGNPNELPKPIEYVTGSRLSREPDLIVPMRDRPFEVAAEGTIEYQYFIVDPGFKEDKWINGAEIIPGNRSVVHHAIVFFRPPNADEYEGIGWLTAYVPGQSTFESPAYQARFVPAGSKFVFQMHYTPTGSPEQDTTKIALLFTDEAEVTEELITLAAINHDFEIPPNTKDFPVHASKTEFPPGAKLQAIAPHMHVRGKSFRVEATSLLPFGEKVRMRGRSGDHTEIQTSSPRPTPASGRGSKGASSANILLDVPNYDFNWQHAYALQQPLPLTNIRRLDCTALFDNSESNLVNPDPSIAVRWGDQTWQEMMIAFLEVAVPRRQHRTEQATPDLSERQRETAHETAENLIKRFDRDGDGVVRRDETPNAFATFAFSKFDANSDKTITLAEALEASLKAARDKANGSGQ